MLWKKHIQNKQQVTDKLHTSSTINFEKSEGTIKNGQSKDTGNIGNTRHRTKTNKKKKIQHNTTQETKKLSNTMNLNLTNEIVWDDQCRENYNVT